MASITDTNLSKLTTDWATSLDAADYSPATVKRYLSAIRVFLRWGDEQEKRPLQLKDLNPILLITYRRDLQQKRSTSTVNLHVAALRAWCEWLYDGGVLAENPASRLSSVGHVLADAPVALSNNAVNALLRAARSSRYGRRNYAICQMLLQTGMRLGECQRLSWGDITFGQRAGSVLIRQGKGNKSRSIPLNSSSRVSLLEYAAPLLGCEPDARLVSKQWGDVPLAKPFWMSQKQNAMSDSAIWRMFTQLVDICARRGLVPNETTPHALRHTFALRYLQGNPGDLVGLARLLGHESLESTKVYLRLSADDLAERIEQIPINAYA